MPGDPAVQYLVEASLGPGDRVELPNAATWSVEPEGVISIEPGGYARPVGTGEAVIRAHEQDRLIAETTVSVRVLSNTERPWDFAADIVPIFTRNGCNTGGCHGRAEGQNGFHLSLFGYDPEADHRAISREAGGRRIDGFRPEESLLIRKATGRVPHGGGVRLPADSDACNTLIAWIGEGAPRVRGSTHGPVVDVTVEPETIWLDEPGPRQLRVVAHYADDHRRDVTRLATFRTNDDSSAIVDEQGRARLLRRAETDLIIRFQSEVIPVRIAAPINPDLAFDFAALPRHNVIDEKLIERLERLKVPPSPPADDARFLRRVSLDLTGELPRPDEIRSFVDDTAPEKRAGKSTS